MAAMSDFKVIISAVRDFSCAMISEREGSAMVLQLVAEAVDGGLAMAAAAVEERLERVGEDRCDRDTRLSRAVVPKAAGPRLRSS
jgi:c-di-AMP phosphodiesterase-like protein